MPGYNSNYGGSTVYVDISDLMDTINLMKCCNLSTGFLGCLFRIHRVVDYDVYPAFDRPYRSDCHQLSSGA